LKFSFAPKGELLETHLREELIIKIVLANVRSSLFNKTGSLTDAIIYAVQACDATKMP
jgi:hypothetical protein